MGFWIAIANLLRSRRVIVSAMLIGLTLGGIVYALVPTQYTSAATMVLTTTEYGGSESRDPQAPTDLTNPMLNFNDSLATTADMLIWSMSDKDVTRSLERDGLVEVLIDDGRSNPDLFGFTGPVIHVSATSADPEEARAVVVLASDMMREKLVEWQYSMNAPPTTYVSMLDIVAPSAPAADRGSQLKLASLALIAGILLCVAVAYASLRAQLRRSARADEEPETEPISTATLRLTSPGQPDPEKDGRHGTPSDPEKDGRHGTPSDPETARAPVRMSSH